MIAANSENLFPPHHNPDPTFLLVSQELDVTNASFFPTYFLTVIRIAIQFTTSVIKNL